jgi:hypothetical protein
MKMLKIAFALTMGLGGCKTTGSGSARLTDIRPGTSRRYRAHVESNPAVGPGNSLVFKNADGSAHHGWGIRNGFSGGKQTLEVDTFSVPLVGKFGVNYGFATDTPWTCYDAYRLVDERYTLDEPPAPQTPPPGTLSVTESCHVQMDTEDDYWYSITIYNLGSAKIKPGEYEPVRALKQMLLLKHPLVASSGTPFTFAPLKPGEVNVDLDASSQAELLRLMQELKARPEYDETERNTCLLNGRAAAWLDIEAHYYCLYPYEPIRKCYSTDLVNKTAGLDKITDKAAAIAALMKAYHESFDDCFAVTSDPTQAYQRVGGKTLLSQAQANAFQYVMWTKAGLMDFNIEAQNRVVNEFYGPGKDKAWLKAHRPRRITDNFTGWVENQPVYDAIRQAQGATLSQRPNTDTKEIDEPWAKTPLPTQDEIDDMWAKDPCYSDYRPGAKHCDYDIKGANEILKAMRMAKDKYPNTGVRDDCLTTGYAPNHWSDLMLHFYCILYQPRECYTLGVDGLQREYKAKGKDPRTSRVEIYQKCSGYPPKPPATEVVPDSTRGADGWPWVMGMYTDGKPHPEGIYARAFKYVMLSQTNTFKPEQEQELINPLWGLSDPKNPDPEECKTKRPMRTEDEYFDPHHEKGIHCQLDKYKRMFYPDPAGPRPMLIGRDY